MSGTHGLAVWVCRYGTCGGSADSLAPCEDERRKVVELSTDDTPVTRVSHHLHSHHCCHHRRCQKIVSFICVIALSFRCFTVCGFPVLLSYCPWLSGAPLLLSVAFRCSALVVCGFPVLPSYCLWLSGAPLLLSVAFWRFALTVCGFPMLRFYCLWLSDAPLLLPVASPCSTLTRFCGLSRVRRKGEKDDEYYDEYTAYPAMMRQGQSSLRP